MYLPETMGENWPRPCNVPKMFPLILGYPCPQWRLPDNIFHQFRLKDPEKVIKCHSYVCPKKYKDAWKQLLDQHLVAGRIWESLSEYCSPSFLIPKADPTVLLRWVNDYRALNENTVPNHYPLPCIEMILSDCAKGSIWAKINMANSFFSNASAPGWCEVHSGDDTIWTLRVGGHANGLQECSSHSPEADEHGAEEVYWPDLSCIPGWYRDLVELDQGASMERLNDPAGPSWSRLVLFDEEVTTVHDTAGLPQASHLRVRYQAGWEERGEDLELASTGAHEGHSQVSRHRMHRRIFWSRKL